MRLTKALGAAGALIVAALVGGTLISSVLAQTDADEGGDPSGTTSAGEYCDVFAETFAEELGISVDELLPAGKAAAVAAIDAAVAAGDLDEDRAAQLKERIESFEGDGCSLAGLWKHGFAMGFGPGELHGIGHGLVRADSIEAAANALGLTSDELVSRMAEAGSLEAIAEEEDVSYDDVKAAVIADVEADLEAAVEEGLDQARADEILQGVQAWLDEGGRAPRLRDGVGPFRGREGEGFGGFGPFGRFGPFDPFGPDDSPDADES